MLLHARNKAEYDAFLASPAQGLLLVGPVGSGKRYVLERLAADLAGPQSEGRIISIEPLPDKKSIGIEQIRELKALLKLAHDSSRVIIIPDAHLLTDDAQNSMLKILEEPPLHVHFLIGAHTTDDVLQTVLSRLHVWRLLPVPTAEILAYFTQYPPERVAKASRIADGRVGLVCAILAHQSDHPLLLAIEQAKDLLGMKLPERLSQVDFLTKDKQKENLPLLIDALELVCKAAMETSAHSNRAAQVDVWRRRTAAVLETREDLAVSVQPKLALTKLFLSL